MTAKSMTAIAATIAKRRGIGQIVFAMIALVLTLGAHGAGSSATSYGVHGMALFGGTDAPFALSALWQKSAPLHEFNAEIFQGHFERDGSSRFKQVKIRVVRVEFHAMLSAKPKVHTGYETYQAVQVGTTNFLFKHIVARPDFDHIVKIAGALDTDTLQVATMPDMASREAALRKALKTQFVRSIYLDDADLN